MSQVQRLYNFLAETRNRATDKALLLGIRRAESPWDELILDTVVDAGRTDGLTDAVLQFHTLAEHQQQLLVDRAAGLPVGLRAAADTGARQGRLNALELIRRARFSRLTDVVAQLLRDKESRIAEHAGVALLALAEAFTDSALLPELAERGQLQPPSPHDADQNGSDERFFLAGVAAALRDYANHRRTEAVLAAMQTVPATADAFWRQGLLPHHPVGRTVKELLGRTDHPEFARFHLSAMTHSWLRAPVAQVINDTARVGYLVALAEHYETWRAQDIGDGLKLVKAPMWLDPDLVPPQQFNAVQQAALADFIADLGAPTEQRFDYLCALADVCPVELGAELAPVLADLSTELQSAAANRALASRHERVAEAVLRILIDRDPPTLDKILVKQMNSQHQRVRELARTQLQKTAFARLWKSFDRLTPEQADKAGRALLKIDPDVPRRLRQCLQRSSPDDRLRAVRMIRFLKQGDAFAAELERLAGDQDGVVRSCTISALGELSGAGAARARPQLIRALKDSDRRVQANAVEALEKLGVVEAAEAIAPFVLSDNNRLRANAIKAQLNWKVNAARKAIEQMAGDQRPPHRRSAAWVARALQAGKKKGQVVSGPDRPAASFEEEGWPLALVT